MIVCHNFVALVLDVNTEQVLENSDVESLPMLVENMCCWSFVWKKKTNKIHKCDLGSIFCYLKHFNQFIDSFLRNAFKIKDLKPFVEIFD